jgi:dimethylaniline monooxygenase (N-oxide forming)
VANSEEGIGGTFQYRSYENAELVSSKQLTTFSDHRFPLSAPDHISLPQYVEYLQSYVDRFELAPFIKLGCPVTSIAPLEKSQWKHRVKYVDRKDDNRQLSFDCSHVAICTGRTAAPYTTHLLTLLGLHVEPNVPEIPGIEHLQGTAFHSSQYKGRAQLTGQDVLVMGCGETGMGMSELLLVRFRANITRCCLRSYQGRCQICHNVFQNRLPVLPQSPVPLQGLRQAVQGRAAHRRSHHQPL